MSALRPIVFLTIGDETVASTRVRVLALVSALEKRGVSAAVVRGTGIGGRVRAIVVLAGRRRPGVVVIQKIIYGRLMLRFLRARASVLIWDCDDAVHFGYPGATPQRVGATLDTVDLVTTTTPTLARELVPATGRVLSFPGPAPAVAEWPIERDRILLWLGSASTSRYLESLADLPRRLRPEGWSCVAIGADAEVASAGWTLVPWSLANQSAWLRVASVGVMPQTSDAWSDRKAAFKILEYAAHGVVPVADDVPPARLLLAGPLASLIVASSESWEERIRAAATNRSKYLPDLRSLVQRFAPDEYAARWVQAVMRVGGAT